MRANIVRVHCDAAGCKTYIEIPQYDGYTPKAWVRCQTSLALENGSSAWAALDFCPEHAGFIADAVKDGAEQYHVVHPKKEDA